MNLENDNENLCDNSVNIRNNEERNDGDNDPFLKEKENLVEKLNNLEINNDEIINEEVMIFEDLDSKNGIEDNYIKMPNGKRKIKKIINKTIQQLFTFKKNKFKF